MIQAPYLAGSCLSARLNYIRIQDDEYLQLGLDPTNTTDSDAALEQAFADAVSSGKKHLVIAGGNYRQALTKTIGANDFRLTFEPSGMITAAPTAAGVASPSMLTSSAKTGILLENINYVGNGVAKSGTKGTSPTAIYLSEATGLRVFDAQISNVRGIALASVFSSDVIIRGGRFINTGQEAGAASGDAPGFVATPAFYCSGGRNVSIEDALFVDNDFSGVFMFTQYSRVKGCSFRSIGESAVYSESINPAGNNGFSVLGNLFEGNNVQSTRIVDISAGGFEISAHDCMIRNNVVTDAGTHGIGMGNANRLSAIGNTIGNCNSSRHALNAGIMAVIGPHPYNPNTQQGRGFIIEGNHIYDERSYMKSGVQWYSGNAATHSYISPTDIGNSFDGLPVGKERVITPTAIVDDQTAGSHPLIGPDTAWKRSFRAVAGTAAMGGATVTTLKSTTIPESYMLNRGAIRIRSEGLFVNNADTLKSAILRFGGVNLGICQTTGAGLWRVEVDVINISHLSQQIIFRYSVAGAGMQIVYGGSSFDTSSSLIVALVGQTGSAGDLVQCMSLSVDKLTG
jgi:hypothetical protein